MKQKSRLQSAFFMVALYFLFGFAVVGCTQTTTTEATFSVTFETDGGTAVDSAEVLYGRRVTRPATDPVRIDGALFDGWYADDGTFADAWNFELDIITADTTIYAKWIVVETYPTEVAMSSVPFSPSVTWIQSGVTAGTLFAVTFVPGTPATRTETQTDPDGALITVTINYFEYAGEGTEVPGTFAIGSDSLVTWTPSEDIQGGAYELVITTFGQNPVTVSDLFFPGSGTQANPFLLFGTEELLDLTTGIQPSDGLFFQVADDFTHEVSFAEIDGHPFAGNLDGNGKTVTVTGNAGLFYELSASAVIENLTVAGTISTSTVGTLGAFVIWNNGTIQNCISRAAITSSAGEVGNPDTMLLGGAAGFAGVNQATGMITNCDFVGTSSADGVVKALIGGGGIASVNYGTISRCENRGCLGGYNSVESGKSMSNYSYMGGICGFNYGTVTESRTTSSGKLLAQRYFNNGSPSDNANNRVIGGIVGYNAASGVVTECEFSGIRVHGDQYVGGIAGINAGMIDSCATRAQYYSTMQYRSYVAGRLDVGGICGLLEGEGTVTHCYAAANLYCYEGTAQAVASTATDCMYVATNHDPRETGTQTYGNVPSDEADAPAGTGNGSVDIVVLAVGDGLDYLFPGQYAATLGAAFVDDNGECVLAWIVE